MEEAAMSGFCMRAAGTAYRGRGNPNINNNNNNNSMNKGTGSCSSGSKCGRWNPTAEQVKLLTQLFTSGLRTPTTDQIQKISSHLSFYGHIESKNVFYWFQNHKARERQKRRKLSSHDTVTNPPALSPHNNKPTHKKVMNEATEPERVIETLQLFPLNSFGESDQTENKLRVHANICRDDTMLIPHTHHQGEQMEHPPLDLRLSFL